MWVSVVVKRYVTVSQNLDLILHGARKMVFGMWFIGGAYVIVVCVGPLVHAWCTCHWVQFCRKTMSLVYVYLDVLVLYQWPYKKVYDMPVDVFNIYRDCIIERMSISDTYLIRIHNTYRSIGLHRFFVPT